MANEQSKKPVKKQDSNLEDVIDPSKGVWPFGGPHPKDAEIVTPAQIAGPDSPPEHAPRVSSPSKEPKGDLPAHQKSVP
ncbi:MAG: hypothetical protein ACXVEF_25305 [Polyangiales bacterium]